MKIAYLTQEFDVEPTRTVRVSFRAHPTSYYMMRVLHQPCFGTYYSRHQSDACVLLFGTVGKHAGSLPFRKASGHVACRHWWQRAQSVLLLLI